VRPRGSVTPTPPHCNPNPNPKVSHNGEAGISVRGRKPCKESPGEIGTPPPGGAGEAGGFDMRIENTRIETNALCGVQVQHGSTARMTKCGLHDNTVGCSLLGFGSHLSIFDTVIRGGATARQGIAVTAAGTVEAHRGTRVEGYPVGVSLTTGGRGELKSGVELVDNRVGVRCEGYREAPTRQRCLTRGDACTMLCVLSLPLDHTCI